ncbi:MAG: benzoyl-CoA 2,3-epoxidase subunit BoxA [Betaproteobacteria bacterium]|nr:benzoyl-CoA 2,3-epoxidase subunit BoxA [Betaproteobacteria bacterium]
MGIDDSKVLKQHLIDPEICIRCNTCEATCPVGAISHDSRNYVVDAEKCNFCMACVPPCPTGSIDNWRVVPKVKAYSLEAQLGWDELPAELSAESLASLGVGLEDAAASLASLAGDAGAATGDSIQGETNALPAAAGVSAAMPPWSAAHPYTNLYGPKAAQKTVKATVTGNFRVTEVGKDYDTHHIVLDFGQAFFPVLEGQSLGIVPPGVDSHGRAHHPRQYSIASPRNGERPGYNNVSLTVKRVLQDWNGNPMRGIGSNYLCDLQVGDSVDVIGPFGSSFLMPNHPKSNIVMICTGTGSAPMRAMTEWRRRDRKTSAAEQGKLMLFFGARTKEELPYFGPLMNLPKDFIDINLVFSRESGKPKRYVQDALRERAADLEGLLADRNTYIYVCGLKAMEEGVVLALRDVASQTGGDWAAMHQAMRSEGRIHFETY